MVGINICYNVSYMFIFVFYKRNYDKILKIGIFSFMNWLLLNKIYVKLFIYVIIFIFIIIFKIYSF